MARRKHYHVYVVELSNDVLLNARFMRSNPDYPMARTSAPSLTAPTAPAARGKRCG